MTRPLVLLLGAALACSDSSSPKSPIEPVGVYSATVFTTTTNGVTTDQLAEGVQLTIELAANGTTTGFLIVPAAGSMPVDLAGTWIRQGSVVTFDQPVVTFLRALPFNIVGEELEGEGVFGPTIIRVTLHR